MRQIAATAIIALAMSLAVVRARAADETAVAPLLGPQTILVARFNAAAFDPAAMDAWEKQMASQLPEDVKGDAQSAVADRSARVRRWVEAFTRAGGKRAYLLADLDLLPSNPVLLAAPVGEGADVQAMERALRSGSVYPSTSPSDEAAVATATQMIGKTLVVGDVHAIEALKARTPLQRPELDKAIAEAGDATLVVAFIPSDETRKNLPDLAPALARFFGGGKTDALSGVQWAVVALTAPPKLALHAVIQCDDADSAKGVGELLQTMLKSMAADKSMQNEMPGIVALTSALSPAAQGDRLVVDLDAAAIEHDLAPAVLQQMGRQWRIGQYVKSASHISKLVSACRAYAADHGGQWPEHLADAASYAGGEEKLKELMQNPLRPGEEDGYAYHRPAASAGGDSAVVFEKAAEHQKNINVGFADGHVEMLDKQEFDRHFAPFNP